MVDADVPVRCLVDGGEEIGPPLVLTGPSGWEREVGERMFQPEFSTE